MMFSKEECHLCPAALGVLPIARSLAIYDFRLFPNLNKYVHGKLYLSRGELVAVLRAVWEMSRGGLQHVYRTLTEIWYKCLDYREGGQRGGERYLEME